MKYKKWEDILTFSAVLLFIILVNVNLKFIPLRIDLTEEKRFTISDATKDLLENLDDVLYVEVYLEGDLNSGFRRLRNSIEETLEEFRVYGGDHIEYKFVNPDEAPNATARNRFYQSLTSKGLPATTLYDNIDGKRTEKVIFPGAIISYRNRETPVLLLKGNKTASAQERLNQSIEGIEYELTSGVRKLGIGNKKNIAFVYGHNELNPNQLQDITTSLSEYFVVDRVQLDKTKLDIYDAVVVAQPKAAFSEVDKYQLDQYIMKGGKALFMIDKVQMNLDSIATGGTYAFGYDLNIEDLLFRYGVRINMDLLQDQRAGIIEVYTGNVGDQPNIERLPWPYYIYLNTFSEHPIVKNMDVVYSKFVSSIDTVTARNVLKTPLIFTSKYTKEKVVPTMVDLNELKADMNPAAYNKSNLPVAYLLEGKFRSLYATSFPPRGISTDNKLNESQPTKVIVVADGDIIANEFDPQSGQAIPLDYDPIRKQELSNKEFLINALNYLTDENGLIASRGKQITMRPLDKFRVDEEKVYWQIFNIALPISLVILFGVIRFYWRKKTYAK
ncbi:gliding motility-associated ABC transporter substrate-binding protein GldG [Chondrinema litorale]|uniref:gliding motility-associated ABC transporter substrate-binding protein GldG n=1 Tax=Chondrinema litorale TaxID=2994555 RepID=UPI0025434483|nr:gliding motility-associated ABC transporter substrate-binding protein GldG [Chondrinema litorale]UZR95575.1 gliding motility-associated ABC transporter substrate-binding protein GldG [Chondrinema litorale]